MEYYLKRYCFRWAEKKQRKEKKTTPVLLKLVSDAKIINERNLTFKGTLSEDSQDSDITLQRRHSTPQ